MEIVEGVHLVDGTNCNVYLIKDGDSWIAVDAGMPGTHRKVLDYAQRLGARITRMVLTHYHVDHIGGAAALREATGAQVLAGAADTPYISGRARPPAPRSLTARLVLTFARARPVPVDMELREGQRVGRFTVLEVPGHTPGSIALYDGKIAIVGDALITRKGRVTLPPQAFTLDPAAARRSAERIASLDFEVLLAGHGKPLVGDAARKVREALGLGSRP